MSSSGSIRAGRAFVELFADAGPLEKGLRDAERKLSLWGRSLTTLGTKLATASASVLGLGVAAVATFANAGSSLVEMSMRTGIAIESLGELGYAAARSGTSIEVVEHGVEKLQRALVEASTSGGEAAKHFEDLGLSVSLLRDLSPEQLLNRVAEAASAISNPTERNARLIAVMGRNAAGLVPLLSRMNELRGEARESGGVMGVADAVAAKELSDSLGQLRFEAASVVAQIGSALTPAIRTLISYLGPMLKDFVAWVRENRAIFVSIAILASATVALGAALVSLGTILGFVAVSLAVLYKAIEFVILVMFDPLHAAIFKVFYLMTELIAMTELGEAALENLGTAGTYLAITLGALVTWLTVLAARQLASISIWAIHHAMIAAEEVGILALNAALMVHSAVVWAASAALRLGMIIDMTVAAIRFIILNQLIITQIVNIVALQIAQHGATVATAIWTLAMIALDAAIGSTTFMLAVLQLALYAVLAVGILVAALFVYRLAVAMSRTAFELRGLSQTAGELQRAFAAAWGGISDALESGDLEGAANIAILGLNAAWLSGIDFLQENWATFFHWLTNATLEAVRDMHADFSWFLNPANLLMLSITITNMLGNVWRQFLTWLSLETVRTVRSAFSSLAGGATGRTAGGGGGSGDGPLVANLLTPGGSFAAGAQLAEALRVRNESAEQARRRQGNPNQAGINQALAELDEARAHAAWNREVAERDRNYAASRLGQSPGQSLAGAAGAQVTFSNRQAQAFGSGGSLQERVVNLQQQQRDLLIRIEEAMRTNVLVFQQ